MKKLMLLVCVFFAGITFNVSAMESDPISGDQPAADATMAEPAPSFTEPVFFTLEELQAIKATLGGEDISDEQLQQITASIVQKKPVLGNTDIMALYTTIINDFFVLLQNEIHETLLSYAQHPVAAEEFENFEAALGNLRELHEQLISFLREVPEARSAINLQLIGIGIQQSIPVLLYLQNQFAQAVSATAAADAVLGGTTRTVVWPRRLLGFTILTGLSAVAISYAGNYMGWWMVPAPSGTFIDFLGNITRLFS